MILPAKFKVGQLVRLNDTDYIIVRATLLYNVDRTAPYCIEKDSVSISYCLVNKYNDDIILNEETLLIALYVVADLTKLQKEHGC